MKLIILILALAMTSCKVYKEQSGQKIERWNARHLQKVHRKSGGMWAGKKYIEFPVQK